MMKTIETQYGRISGLERKECTCYLGVPYAQAPVGDLRWRAPQKMLPYEGVLHADHFPDRGVQFTGSVPPWDKDFYDDPAYEPAVSEDCLYLNLWVPRNAEGAPVVLWIHGGAFDHGHAGEKEFDGEAYARRGVIFVSIQYRLGVLGFLAHPWLTAEAGRSGNYGLLDQIMALQWVHENIAAFGGDPSNIAVMGQSAGAMSVQSLVSSPLASPLISKAILQSGVSCHQGLLRDITMKQEEEYGEVFAEILQASSLEEMRARSAEEILKAQKELMNRLSPKAGGMFLVPVIDGFLLPEGYDRTIDSGSIRKISYLVGCTKDDILVPKNSQSREDSPLYCAGLNFGRRMEKLGQKTYVYYFQRDLPGDDQGAWHSSELWYMMGTLDRCWRPWTKEDWELSEKMLDYWSCFIKTGNPCSDPAMNAHPLWRPCTAEDPFVMDFDV